VAPAGSDRKSAASAELAGSAKAPMDENALASVAPPPQPALVSITTLLLL
jgi:hypothetical protein